MALLSKAGVFNSLHLFNPKKGPSHEETTQNALSMLPMGWGCSVGSLTYHSEISRLYNTLRLQEAEFYCSAILLKNFFFLFYVPIFRPHLTIRAKYILTNGSRPAISKPLERNGFRFRNGTPFPG